MNFRTFFPIDISMAGLGKAIKQALISFGKYMIAAALLYVGNHLTAFVPDPTTPYAELILKAIGLAYVGITFLQHWLGTTSADTAIAS